MSDERPVCQYCTNPSNTKHPLFVYLLSDKRCINNPSKHKIVPYIGITKFPMLKLCKHNRINKRLGYGNQLTKLGAPNYQIELVFGPIFHGGKYFKFESRKKSRKIISRILYFCDYARSLQRANSTGSLYVRDKSLIQRLYVSRANEALRNKRV